MIFGFLVESVLVTTELCGTEELGCEGGTSWREDSVICCVKAEISCTAKV